MAGDDQRQDSDRRRERRDRVTLIVEYEGADDLVGDYTQNLSTGGVYVQTERRFELGTEVRLALSFPGLLQPVALEGVVRWTRDGEDDRGVGIEFVDQDGPTRARLASIVARIRERDPAYVSRMVKVLVVEDNPHVSQLIRDGLRGGERRFGEPLSFGFRTASNGREALAMLDTDSFDALLIDIYLPVLDGASVIAEVRRNERHGRLPIIAVSAGGASAKQAALGAGADFFLEKPMRLRQIIETMKRLMIARR